MTLIADNPSVVKSACNRFLLQVKMLIQEAALLGARGVWIEEAFTDMISPKSYAALGLPFVWEMAAEIRRLGMKSIYYYCGNIEDRLEFILSSDADALAFEESKKNFHIELESVIAQVNGRCTVLGNLNTISILQNGSEEQLKSEIRRQMDIGGKNNNRFIMCLGSPVTPLTSIARVKNYVDYARSYSLMTNHSGEPFCFQTRHL